MRLKSGKVEPVCVMFIMPHEYMRVCACFHTEFEDRHRRFRVCCAACRQQIWYVRTVTYWSTARRTRSVEDEHRFRCTRKKIGFRSKLNWPLGKSGRSISNGKYVARCMRMRWVTWIPERQNVNLYIISVYYIMLFFFSFSWLPCPIQWNDVLDAVKKYMPARELIHTFVEAYHVYIRGCGFTRSKCTLNEYVVWSAFGYCCCPYQTM